MPLDGLVSIVLPVFGIIALGYGVVAARLLPETAGDHLGDFVFLVPIPLLLFRAIGTAELPPISPWPFWGAYFAAALLALALGMGLVMALFKRSASAGVIAGMAAGYANIVMVGLPVAREAYGEPGLTLMLLLIAVHAPLMLTISTVLLEVAARSASAGHGRAALQALRHVATALLRNPLIVAIAAGLAFRLSGLTLAGVPRTVLDRVSDTAIPLALIALGMSLHKYGLRGNARPAVVLGVVKLALMPAVVYALAGPLLQLDPVAVGVLVIAAACPSGINAYLLATRAGTGLALSANTVTLTTAASLITLSLWLSLISG